MTHWIEESTICPICEYKLALTKKQTFNCHACKSTFPYVNDIPVIVPDWEKHLRKLNYAITNDPGWFEKSQVNYYDNGPYRVHLKRRQDYVSSIIGNYISGTSYNHAKILDLGCGDGQNLRWLKGFINKENLYGTDYNILRLSRAAHLIPDAKLCLMDLMFPVFQQNFFDVIYCNHVLEHIVDVDMVLHKISIMLDPSGLLIIGVPNEGAKWWQLAYDLEPELLGITDHRHFFDMPAMKKMLREAGFAITHEKYMGYGLPHFTADSIFRNIPGVDDILEKIGQQYFKDQASSIYFVCIKK